MTDFNSVQRETINLWRQARGFGILEMPDEKAASIMLQEMKDSGTVYPGFESLLRNASTPSPSLYSTNTSPSLFGWGAKENVGHQSNYAYDMAIKYLEDMTNSAQRNMDIQALRQGVISGAAAWDLFKNVFDMEYSSGNVNKAISSSKNDIERLKLASTGQLVGFMGQAVEFEDEFRRLRGVEFDVKKIKQCDTNAKSLAQARTTKKIFDEVKAKLNSASVSSVRTMMTQDDALIGVFSILCVNENGAINVNAVNEVLANIEKANEGNSALRYGTDLKLERNDKGEYEFRVTTQNGERNPITAEHLDMLKGSLTEMLDTMMAIQLGIEFDSNTPIEDVRRLTSEEMVKREADYKESFSEAYGKKDLNELSEEFVQGQMTADMVTEGIVNIGSMALMLTGSGVLVKGAQWTSKMLSAKHAAKVAEIAQKATTAAQKATPVLVGVQVTQPVKALDLVSSEATWKGLAGSLKEALGIELTEEEITAQSIALEKLTTYGMTVAEASAWMMLGMASGAVGDKARLFLKQKGLANIVKNSGKSINNLMDMYKSGKITGDLAKTLSRMEQIATMSGNGLEFGVDVLLTYAGNQALHGEGLTLNDLLMSMNGVLIGSAMQKQMLNKPYEARLEDFRTQIKNNDPSISDKDLDIRAKTLLELSKLAESKIDLTPKTGVIESLKYSEFRIRNLVASTPALKDNAKVLSYIEEWLNTCKDVYVNNGSVQLIKEKLENPLLKQHRLELLEEFLKTPELYNNGYFVGRFNEILRCYEAKTAKDKINTIKSFRELCKQYPPEDCLENKNVLQVLTLLLKKVNMTSENKTKILKDLIESKDFESYQQAGDFLSHIQDGDDVDFLLEFIHEVEPSLKQCATLMFGKFDIGIKDFEQTLKLRKEMYNILKNDPEISHFRKASIVSSINPYNIDIAKKYYKDENFGEVLDHTIRNVNEKNKKFVEEILADSSIDADDKYSIVVSTHEGILHFVRNELYLNEQIPRDKIAKIASHTTDWTIDFARQLIADKNIDKNEIGNLLGELSPNSFEFAKYLYNEKTFSAKDISEIITYPKEETIKARREVLEALKEMDFPVEHRANILKAIDKDNALNKDYAIQLCREYSKMELPPEKIHVLVAAHNKINPADMKKLLKRLGKAEFAKLSDSDMLVACQLVDIHKVTNINEIPQTAKKDLLRRLVASNDGLFKVSDELRESFPLIPKNQEEYCTLLPAIVRSMGIETNTLKPQEVESFNKSMNDLGSSLAKVSDEDFANLHITQEFSREEFINIVLEKTKGLSSKERQKVYDYFGFELHYNKTNSTKYTITGYPVNLNNGKKLAQITNPKTKEVVELLRADVIRFSEQNPIKCENPEIEKLLNEVVEVLPELRAQIGKVQHGVHDFDVLQHSLKVMQKISQDPKYQELNDSDKKIMMLASLLHDITKPEGQVGYTHANEGSFDAFFIAKKFELTREEEVKLYTLIKHHEWLKDVNTAKNQADLTKRLQSVAYDLQNDNLFDMALIFTHADLKSVKANDSFHDTKDGKGRMTIEGTRRSFGASADVYATRIRGYVKELQKSQPFLPVTKMPTASRINEAITVVNPDGSTNIKGVYKNSDGLVVIKFNEVEDWEVIGFPKGSCSKGISAKGVDGRNKETDVDTGNIKFFAHALDYENQLAKFDAFSLVDSDALLSISYAERPESKYRFFRPQGVLLDFDTKYIHGGGNTDSGSGYKKSIAEIKEHYIFGGGREEERLYVSNLIKEATGMSDAEYVDFVQANQNKGFTEIEPVELRNTIIQALATINSNVRKGNRSYNEMYGSNPNRVMAVFAYNTGADNINDPIKFVKNTNRRTDFLQKYALEHDIPFIVFGD